MLITRLVASPNMQTTAIFFLLSAINYISTDSSCPENVIVAYKLLFDGEWAEMYFPNEYPKNAQWSEMVVQTHSINDYHLFREGQVATAEFRKFVLDYNPESLLQHGQKNNHVFDQILDPALPKGRGYTQNIFYVNRLFPAVSLARVLIPTSDWFSGADSIDLCSSSSWTYSKMLYLKLYDAGAAKGSTFSLLKNVTQPPEKVEPVDFNDPNSGVFYYPKSTGIAFLPFVARITIIKIQEYYIDEKKKVSIHDMSGNIPSGLKDSTLKLNFVSNVIQALFYNAWMPKELRERANVPGLIENDCVVSEWTDWSPCSGRSIRSGFRVRKRFVHRRNKGDGVECLGLHEQERCSANIFGV